MNEYQYNDLFLTTDEFLPVGEDTVNCKNHFVCKANELFANKKMWKKYFYSIETVDHDTIKESIPKKEIIKISEKFYPENSR